MTEMAKLLIFTGIIILIAGFVMLFLSSTSGTLKLPGDIYFKRGNFTFFFPIMSSILISIILTIVLNLFVKK